LDIFNYFNKIILHKPPKTNNPPSVAVRIGEKPKTPDRGLNVFYFSWDSLTAS
jgi:hypothetical protein